MILITINVVLLALLAGIGWAAWDALERGER